MYLWGIHKFYANEKYVKCTEGELHRTFYYGHKFVFEIFAETYFNDISLMVVLLAPWDSVLEFQIQIFRESQIQFQFSEWMYYEIVWFSVFKIQFNTKWNYHFISLWVSIIYLYFLLYSSSIFTLLKYVFQLCSKCLSWDNLVNLGQQ